MIEYHESSETSYHLRKLIQVDAQYRKLFYYHHRNKDGIIYREEQIGKKTFEYYKNRDDHLIYRSVSFLPHPAAKDQSMTLNFKDKHFGETECVIKKMTCKYELNPALPPEDQMRKTEFNLDKH